MGDVNKVTLIGTLVWRSARTASFQSGMDFVHFRIHTNVPFVQKEGTEQNDHQEHACIAFGDTVEQLMNYKVHTKITVTGRLKYQQIGQDPMGRNVQSARIIVENIRD